MYSLLAPATMLPLSAFEIPTTFLEPTPPPLSSPPSSLHAESPTLPSAPLGTSPLPASMSPLLPPPSEVVPASSPVFIPQPTSDPPLSPPPSTLTLLPPPASLPSPAAPVPMPLPFPFPSAPVNFPPLTPVPPIITSPPTSPVPLPSPITPVSQPSPLPFPSTPVHFPPLTPVSPAITSPTSPVPLLSLMAPVSQPPPFPFPFTPVNFPTSSPVSPAFQPKSPQVTSMPFNEPPPWSSGAPPTSLLEPPLSSSLPIAVDVNTQSGFNMSSAVVVGLVIGGAILAFLLGLLTLLYFCRGRCRREKKHDDIKELPNIGSKGSHVIQLEPCPIRQPTISHESSKGSSSANSGSKNAIPNHAPITVFGSGNHIFTYDELVVATNGFSEDKLLGQGGFRNVYKGVLPNGKEIAVKQLKTGSQQGEREFQAEVETISRVHHKHLVELVGYSINRAERLLAYEFVPNNTLEFHLHGKGNSVMEWTTRMKIAIGSAKGLAYLHEDCNPTVIHRDIKASNILLDYGFEAKVSDFGLAKIFPNTDSCITHITTRVVGTFGYLAPEYASSGKLTDKSDVYSFGVMLLELITGRLPIRVTESSIHESLVDWARPLLARALEEGNFDNLADPRLQKNYRDEEMARMVACAAACVRHSARLRPRVSQIAGALEGLVSLSNLAGDIKPGHTALYSGSGSSNYDVKRYQEDMKNFNLALAGQKYNFDGNSDSTSDYGLSPSDSNSEFLDTK